MYPECLGKMFMVNTPFIFSGLWSVIKGWLDEKIRRKIIMLGKNYYSTLLEYVDDDQIPVYLGGSNPATFIEDRGPWQEYDLIDSNEPGA